MAKTFATWVSQLDERTTIICLDAHGQVVEADELFVTMAGSLQGPPAHWGCRSLVDIRVLTVTREVTFRDRANEGRRFERVERRRGRQGLTDRRKELGRERYQKQLARARVTNPPPGVPYLSEYRSRGPLRLLEAFADDTGMVTLGAVRPPTVSQLPGWKPTMTRAEAQAWARGSTIDIDLFHGLTPEAAASVRANGFQMRRLGEATGNGGLMGAGHYFATTAAEAYGARGATLAVRVRVNQVAYFGETEFMRAQVAAKVAAHGDAVAIRASGVLDEMFRGQRIGDWVGDMSDEYLDALAVLFREEQWGREHVIRQVLIDDGFDAVVWRNPGLRQSGLPDEFADWREVAVLRDDAIVVIEP